MFAELLQGLWVHFGNDEGDVFVQAEVGGVVDDEGNFRGEGRQKFCREGSSCAGEGEVCLSEVEAFEFLCFECFVSVCDVCSDGLRGGECVDAICGKVSFCEDGDEFSSDITCGADDGDIVGHERGLGRGCWLGEGV